MADDDLDVDTGTDENTDDEKDTEQEDSPALREDGKPYTAKDIAALKESLTKARRDARAAKRQQPAQKDDEGDGPSKADLDNARKDAERYKAVGLRQAAKAAFAEAGLANGSAFNKVFRMLDLEDLTIGDDGEVEGLDDQIDEIKEDVPGLFERKEDKPKRTPRVGTGRSSEDGDGGKKTEEASETLAKMLFNGGRR